MTNPLGIVGMARSVHTSHGGPKPQVLEEKTKLIVSLYLADFNSPRTETKLWRTQIKNESRQKPQSQPLLFRTVKSLSSGTHT